MNRIKFKKSIFSLLITSLSATAIAAGVVSCSPTNSSSNNTNDNSGANFNRTLSIDYDLGLATEPINNLNYVRYKSVDKILPSLVDSFIKNGPDNTLKRTIKTNPFTMIMVNTSKSVNENNELSPVFDDLW
ncbi:Uncharacterised protein, partial [Mycoplasmopsis edwardii]